MNRRWIFSGQAHPALAQEVAHNAGIAVGQAEICRFPDGELSVQIREDVRDDYVFVLQPLHSSEAIVELLLLANALKHCRPRRLVLMIPYYGYGRQERRTGQSSVGAQVIADIVSQSGADAIVTLDLHTPIISSFVTLPHVEMSCASLFASHIRHQVPDSKPTVVVSPDQGGIGRANRLNAALSNDQAVFALEKCRLGPAHCLVTAHGQTQGFRGKHAILVDDIVSTGGTLIQAAQQLADLGADSIWACVTHLVASPDSLAQRLADSPIERLLVSNSVPKPEILRQSKIQKLSLAPLLTPVVIEMGESSRMRTWGRFLPQRLLPASFLPGRQIHACSLDLPHSEVGLAARISQI